MKYLIAILAFLLIATNLFWLYSVIDNGVTNTYQEASIDSTVKMLEQSIIIANQNVVGISLDDAQSKFTKDVNGTKPFVKDGCLYLGQICLAIGQNNTIIGVKTVGP